MDHSAPDLEANNPFTWKEQLGYAMGDIGNGFGFQLVSNYLMIYTTNAIGIAPWITAILLPVPKLVGAFSDVFVGRMADNGTLHADGRFIPWMRKWRYPLLLAMVLLFLPFISSWSIIARSLYLFVFYIAWNIFYSAVNIPYGSLASVATPVVAHRDKLSNARGLGSSIGGLLVGYILPLLAYTTIIRDGKPVKVVSGQHFMWIAIVFAVLAWAAYEITIRLCKERIRVDKSEQPKVDFLKLLKSLFTSRAMTAIVVAALILILSSVLTGSINTYLYTDYFRDNVTLAYAQVMGSLTSIVLAPFAPAITRRFGKREACGVALLSSSALYLIMYFLHITNPWVFVVFLFFSQLGSGLFNLMVWSFITDVIDDQQVRTHTREDGTVYSAYSFARKIGQAAAASLGGLTLAWTGYQAAQNGVGVAQTAGTLSRIYTASTVIPAITYLIIALILLFWYPLSKKQLLANQTELAGRRAQGIE